MNWDLNLTDLLFCVAHVMKILKLYDEMALQSQDPCLFVCERERERQREKERENKAIIFLLLSVYENIALHTIFWHVNDIDT